MSRLTRRIKKYKKRLFIFFIILLVLGLIFLGYVYNSMVVYERNLPENYIKYLVENNKLLDNLKEEEFNISKYEIDNATLEDGLKKLFKSNDLTYKKNSTKSLDNTYVYDIYNNDDILFTVSLDAKKTYTKMAILTVTEWDITDVETNLDKGIYNYEINIPSTYKLYLNDSLVSDSYVESDDEKLEKLTKYIKINPSNTYTIDNLVYKPSIKIVDSDNKEVSYNIDGNKISIDREYTTYDTFSLIKSKLKTDIDVLKIAENWSLFLTNDLTGAYHGFSQFTSLLITDSYMYTMAYNWSHNVDITFVSKHTLKSPTFTNESVTNCIEYSSEAFSCEVYLEKNMTVSGNDKVDTLHDRLYFIYYDNGYKLVDMEAL